MECGGGGNLAATANMGQIYLTSSSLSSLLHLGGSEHLVAGVYRHAVREWKNAIWFRADGWLGGWWRLKACHPPSAWIPKGSPCLPNQWKLKSKERVNSWTSSLSFVHLSYWCAGVKLQQTPIETLKLNSLPLAPLWKEEGESDQRGRGGEKEKIEREWEEESGGKKSKKKRKDKKRAFCLISPIQNHVA